MRAMVYRRYGGPDNLRLEQIPQPSPRDDEVLIRVAATSLNYWDFELLRGTATNRLMGAPLRPRYSVLGADVAGVVEAVGAKVSRLMVGDEVFGDLSFSGWGGLAEYTCAREGALAPKPPEMSFVAAASVPQAGALALRGMNAAGEIASGASVLITGAAGGVGSFAVQMAKAKGAEVTGVDRGDKLDAARAAGADHVIDYTREDFTQGSRRYDAVIDVAMYRSTLAVRRVLNPGGRHVVLGGSTPLVMQTMVLLPWLRLAGSRRTRFVLYTPKIDDLTALSELATAGVFRPVIDRRYPLQETAEAMRYLGSGNVQGKLVIEP